MNKKTLFIFLLLFSQNILPINDFLKNTLITGLSVSSFIIGVGIATHANNRLNSLDEKYFSKKENFQKLKYKLLLSVGYIFAAVPVFFFLYYIDPLDGYENTLKFRLVRKNSQNQIKWVYSEIEKKWIYVENENYLKYLYNRL